MILMDEINTDLSEILRGLKWLKFLSNCGLLYKRRAEIPGVARDSR
jgi:hypothetical protein